MKITPLFSILIIFIVATFTMQGCQDSTITNTKAKPDPVQSLRYTGRDSLIARPGGVAMMAKISGSWHITDNPDCSSPDTFLSGTGTGHVTHLGRTQISQTACIDEDGNITGTFSYVGQSGAEITGSYAGTIIQNALDAKVTLETSTVQAPRENPSTDENWGGGKFIGNMDMSDFHYEFIGWLFHHETGN